MALSNNLHPGMTISLDGKLFRIESCVKVTVAKGNPFIKTKLRNLTTQELSEKNFKLNQTVQDVSLVERKLEYLYIEGKDYLFLDIGNLDKVLIPAAIIGNKVTYLKEGIELKASFYGETVFAVEVPQFLELLVVKTEADAKSSAAGTKMALLETGAKIEIPPFIESGDIIKVDTKTDEYIQRV